MPKNAMLTKRDIFILMLLSVCLYYCYCFRCSEEVQSQYRRGTCPFSRCKNTTIFSGKILSRHLFFPQKKPLHRNTSILQHFTRASSNRPSLKKQSTPSGQALRPGQTPVASGLFSAPLSPLLSPGQDSPPPPSPPLDCHLHSILFLYQKQKRNKEETK